MSFYDDASLVFLAGGAAGKDGKVYNIKPRQKIIGEELITNGTFDTDSDWTKVGESTISGGKGNIISTAGVWSNLNQTNVFTVGKHYRVALDVTVNSNDAQSAIKIQDGGTDANIGTVATSGSYEFFYTAEGTTLTIARFSVDSAVDASIDNVSVKEVEGVTADFNFYRGTNLTASRVGKDGYIEKGRENLLLQSNQFDTSPWTDPNADVTGGQEGRDGGNDAWELSLTGTFGQTAQDVSASGISGVNTLSFYAKSGTSDFTRPYIAGPNKYAYFDLLNGQTGVQTGVASSIEDAGNGWWRCSFTVEGSITEVRLHVADSISTIGTSTSGTIYIQDAQLEQGLSASDYIETGATTAKAGLLEDEPRFDYTGGGCPALLMEPERTNKQTHSEYLDSWSTLNLSLTTNAAKSPEGVKNASKIVESTDTGLHRFNKQWTFVDGTIYSLSFFAKAAGRNKIEVKYGTNTVANFHATFTLDGTDPVNIGDGTASMQSMGDGWYRCKIENIEGHRLDTGDIHPESLSTAFNLLLHNDANPTESSYEGDGSSGVLIYGFQQEEGAFATSYIPTYGAEGTRTLDGTNSSSNIMIPPEAFDLTSDFAIMMDLGDINYTHGTSASSFPLLFLITGSSNKNFGFYFNPGTSSEDDEGVNVYFQNNGNYVFGTGSNDAAAGDSKVLVTYNSTTDKLAYYINGELLDSETRALSYDASTRGYFQALSATADGDECSFEINKIIFFDNDLSVNDSQILTGTSYTNFAAMASELSYTKYE